jgi:hypothetical protein
LDKRKVHQGIFVRDLHIFYYQQNKKKELKNNVYLIKKEDMLKQEYITYIVCFTSGIIITLLIQNRLKVYAENEIMKRDNSKILDILQKEDDTTSTSHRNSFHVPMEKEKPSKFGVKFTPLSALQL